MSGSLGEQLEDHFTKRTHEDAFFTSRRKRWDTR
jgi:hypothetical protein